MLKSGSAELSLAGENSTPLHRRPSPHMKGAAWERGWGIAVWPRAGLDLFLGHSFPTECGHLVQMRGLVASRGTGLPKADW